MCVKLIGSLRELGAPRNVALRRSSHHNVQVQRVDKIRQRERFAPDGLPLSVGPVKRGSLPIRAAFGASVQHPEMAQRPEHSLRVGGHTHGAHLRDPCADGRALDLVVVQKEEAVEAQVQARGQAAETLGFRIPGDLSIGDVLSAQPHIGMMLEHGPDVLRHVFARQRKEPTVLHLRDHLFLKALPVRPDTNAGRPVLSADPIPERVIAIQYDDLARRAARQIDCANNLRPERREDVRRVRNMRNRVTFWIEPIDSAQGDMIRV